MSTIEYERQLPPKRAGHGEQSVKDSPAMFARELMTTHEVARVLGISPTKVTRLVRDAAIPHVPIRDDIRFDESDLWEWIEQQKRVAKAASVVA